MKQKFFEVYNRYYKRSDKLDRMVELADDYAIEFAEWLVIRYNEDIIYDEYSTKELLEIFKEEKGL